MGPEYKAQSLRRRSKDDASNVKVKKEHVSTLYVLIFRPVYQKQHLRELKVVPH